MNNQQFEKVVHNRLDRIQAILAAKASEYARGDRLSNFKRAADMERCTPERALMGMMAKHWVSVLDLIDDVETHLPVNEVLWDEKIGDSINYLILLEALVIERWFNEQAQFSKLDNAAPAKARKK